jgi:stage IV sporulation protein A
MGTEKVIKDHSTIGVVVTTDGSFTGIDRSSYQAGEEKAVAQLKAIGKPFAIVLNCVSTDSAGALKKELENKYGVPVVAMNVEKMQEQDVCDVLQAVLFTFPVNCIDVRLPKWLQTFPESNATVGKLLQVLKRTLPSMKTMRDCVALENLFDEGDCFINPLDIRMDLGTGGVELTIDCKPNVYYQVISDVCGEEICDDLSLMRYVCALAQTKTAYGKIKDAFEEAEKNGYGIVYPSETEYCLDKPRLLKKSSGYGAHFRANAPSYHIIKVDVTGSVNPIIGTKEQSESFIDETVEGFENGMDGVWETNIFGRSLRALVGDELSGKTSAMPIELRKKMRRTVTKIVNDGKNNAICLLF